MSRIEKLRELARRGATEGEREAARRALAAHEERLLTSLPEPAAEPVGPNLTRRSGRPFYGVEREAQIWVPTRETEETAREWIADRRRMLVRVRGERRAMVPTSMWVDDDDGVWLTADTEDLDIW